MKLHLGDDSTIPDVQECDIDDAFPRLSAMDDPFAILSTEDETMYVQTYSEGDGTFLVEYQIGSTDNHFRARDGALPHTVVIDIFKRFLRRDPQWNQTIEWEHAPM